MKRIVALLMAVVLAGCSGMSFTSPPGAKYAGSVCVEAATLSGCLNTGTVTVRGDGEQLATLVVALAGPYLAKSFNYKGCAFTTYPESVEGKIVVTGTAACSLHGVPVPAKVVVTLTPVVAETT